MAKIIGNTVGTTMKPQALIEKTTQAEQIETNTQNIKEINDARNNGEFKGERGTGTIKVTTAPSSYTTAIGDYTPKYRIALSTVKSQGKVDEVLIGDIISYSYYHYQVDYLTSSYAYISKTRVSIRGATGADGDTGPAGPVGYYYTPSLDDSGNLSWTNNGELSNPATVNIKGPKGDTGSAGPAGPTGPAGERGAGIYKVTTAPSSYTTEAGGFTPTYRISLSTVKSQSGATEIIVGDQLRYSYYLYPVGYVSSSYVYCDARVSIRGSAGSTGATGPQGVSISSVEQTTTSTADGGTNVITVTLSDGTTSTFNVKNGSKGSDGGSASGGTNANGVYYIEGTGTTAGTWTGTRSDITAYYDGLMIAYKINVAGSSDGTTLNINGLGAKVVRRNASNFTTYLPVGTVALLVYTTIDGVGYWVWADYNVDTKSTANSTNTSNKIFLIGATSQGSAKTTYSHDTAYVGTDGCLYSDKKKVSVEGHTHDVTNPNLLINGNFQVWQNGSSGTTIDSSTWSYVTDRFRCKGSGTVSLSNVSGNRGMKVSASTTVQYVMEDYDYALISGKIVTLSYSVNGTTATNTFTPSSSTVFELTMTANQVLNWVKLELGSVATPCVPKPISQEIRDCQRYRRGLSQTFAGYTGSDGTLYIPCTEMYAMRTTPSISINGRKLNFYYEGAITSNVTINSISVYDSQTIAIKHSAQSSWKNYPVNGYCSSNFFLDSEIYD